jgi:hypothetical protein
MTIECKQCKSELAEAAIVCTNCGAAADMEERGDSNQATLISPTSRATDVATPEPATSSAPIFSIHDDLPGIGGWLILSAIGLAISPILSLHGVFRDFGIIFGDSYELILASRPGLGRVIVYEAVTNTFFLTFGLLLNTLFYMKKKAFPGLMIAYLAVGFVLMLADQLMAMQFSNSNATWINVIRQFITASIWIPYFLVSQRVKATFVR